MKAFTSTKVSKPELLAVLEEHSKADNFMKGSYWQNGKGCAVGCSLESFQEDATDHGAFEPLFGIPRVLARLEDGIFEGLSNEDAKWWPLAFTEAIPLGADLSMVWPKFAVWLLGDKEYGVIRHAKSEDSKKAANHIVELYEKKINGEEVGREIWLATRRAAYAAAAADAADYAADYAAADAAAADARQQSRKRQADKLIEIIKES